MNRLWQPGWLWALLLLLLLLSAPATAGQFTDMVQGLRERQYFDYALVYLDQLAAKPDLPAEVRQELPYEKALVLIDSSKVERLPEKQLEQLDQAQAFLEQFAKENPNHARAGDANSQRADILLGKARVEIMQSRADANQGARGQFQERARTLIAQARQVFETAQTQHEAAWQSYGSFVNEEKDPEKYQAREQALMQLISAMLNVCQCRYEEAQTYDKGSPEFKKVLNQAAEEFEKLHQRYRNYTGGLYARLYEAKCFDDQGETARAMGIYNELLDHDGSNRNLRKLQNKTLQFKLEALNRKSPPDSQVVVDLAAEWLKENKAESRTQTGLSIQWEQALAYEALGDQREASKGDKDRNWRTARNSAMMINKFRSIYSDVSMSMIQRLDAKLGGKERKPENFETAQGMANQHFKTVQEMRKELEGMTRNGGQPSDEQKKLEQDLQSEMHDAAELYQLALNLADKNDDPKEVSKARLWFSYVHFWAGRNYEAAILSQYVARTAPKEESTMAMDAAYLAMVSHVKAYNAIKGPVDTKLADLGFVVRACEFLISRWPDTEKANEARMIAGRMYSLSRKPIEAAAWFSKIPEADARFSEAQLAAGQAFWDAYRLSARLPEDQRPTTDQLHQYQALSEKHLRTGIAKMTATLPTEGLPPADLMGAKFSLADILISQGKDADAITVLTADPQSVTKAVQIEDEKQRPNTGVKKRVFAVEVYKLLLRAYIGNSKLDEARASMKTLEGIAGGGPEGADITELYVGLGRLLKDELDRYRAANETDRFNALRTSFETFLNDVYQRKEGHSIGTLSWVGETYAALGEADVANQASAMAYYDKAANAFQEIVRQTESNAGFATTDQLLAVKVRLVHSLRMRKDFSGGEKLMTELLKQRKDDLKLQIEAALLYHDWASEPGEEKKYLIAINGSKENQTLGFGPLARRIQTVMRGGKRPELFDTYLDTRFQITSSRSRYAQTITNSKDKRDQLNNAELELTAFARVTKDVPDDWRARFNGLYREIRQNLGDPNRPVKDLEWTTDLIIDPKPETDVAEKPKTGPEKDPAVKTGGVKPPPPPPGIDWISWGLGIFCTVVTLGIIAMLAMKKKAKPSLRAQESASMSFDLGDVPTPSKPGGLVGVGAPREKRTAAPGIATATKSAAPGVKSPSAAAVRPSSAAPGAAKPATSAKPAAPGATKPAAPKPKPKPPPAAQ